MHCKSFIEILSQVSATVKERKKQQTNKQKKKKKKKRHLINLILQNTTVIKWCIQRKHVRTCRCNIGMEIHVQMYNIFFYNGII